MTRTFNSKAIPKCQERMGKAKRALQQCRSARNFNQFASFWSDFLIHSGGVLNALDAGSKETPQGRQWYGGVKRAGRSDPLVTYMHQARNSEEHALSPTTKNVPASIGIGRGEDVYIRDLSIDETFYRNPEAAIAGRVWRTTDGKPPTIEKTPGGPELLPVTDDRYKTTFPPPREHNGKKLEKSDPIYIAELYVLYLERIIKAASDLS